MFILYIILNTLIGYSEHRIMGAWIAKYSKDVPLISEVPKVSDIPPITEVPKVSEVPEIPLSNEDSVKR